MIALKGQRKAVKEYLESGNSITNMEAFSMFGVTRLSAIIFDLRKAGYCITTNIVEGKTRYGTSCEYAKYSLTK